MKNILTSFFAESDYFCGSEKTLHALFSHHMTVTGGIAPTLVVREHRLDAGPVDVVQLSSDLNSKPVRAFEFKGGAYGNRNALHDIIDASGHCKDLDKLKPVVAAGCEAWFVCVDMAELGIALSPEARQRVAIACMNSGIRFAYHCQGEPDFWTADSKGIRRLHISGDVTPGISVPLDIDPMSSWLQALSKLCSQGERNVINLAPTS